MKLLVILFAFIALAFARPQLPNFGFDSQFQPHFGNGAIGASGANAGTFNTGGFLSGLGISGSSASASSGSSTFGFGR